MKVPKNIEQYAKYFSEGSFLEKLLGIARRLGMKAVYYALVLYYAVSSPDLPSRDRKIIIGTLGYLILPLDLIPDFIPVAGFTDDAVALTIAVYRVMNNITPEVRAKAHDKVRDIFGEVDEVEVGFPTEDPDIDEQ